MHHFNLSRCYVPRRVINHMAAEANARTPLETGGVLLGFADPQNVWIETAIGPGPRALHQRTSFVPDGDYDLRHIAEA